MSAPALIGDTWFGTGGRRLSLDDLRGRIVLLDFWTLCCVNCHHVLAELRPIEAKYSDVLTVVGVHSPKFEHEKNPDSVHSAIERHGIDHPVLNDPNLSTWSGYGVRAWPTLVLIDPLGAVVAQFSGEGHAHAIDATIAELVKVHEADGTLSRGDDVFVAPPPPRSIYRQPGKATLIDQATLLVSDSANHRVVIADPANPNAIVRTIGSGSRGLRDGSATEAQFNEPYGVLRLPDEIAAQVGYDLVVADSVNHALRGVVLATGAVTTVAGTGEQWMQGDSSRGDARATRLSTPWDVAWHEGRVVVAMAGEHRIWSFDPVTSTVEVFAGTTNEGLVDGARDQAWFAQPSGVVSDGQVLWVVDSETSAIRRIEGDTVSSPIGHGLFDFGHVDGAASEALLQHPLGAAVLPDGSLVIADSYNGAIRRYDPSTETVTTIARDLREPSDVVYLPQSATLLVVESAAGALTAIPIAAGERVESERLRTSRPAITVTPGAVTIEVIFEPPPGEKRDDRYGPSTQLVVSASPAGLISAGAGTTSDLVREIQVEAVAAEGVLHVAAKGASCDDTGGDPDAHAACHIHQQDWGVPIVIDPAGERVVRLVLSGGDPASQ
ncbi:MAG: NHL domain-containing thioredoxin family protein [Candidatus Nanopelagicales bacterium]